MPIMPESDVPEPDRWPGLVEAACQVMHDAYESAATENGWETQAGSRKPWSEVPEENKATMRAAMSVLLDWLEIDD